MEINNFCNNKCVYCYNTDRSNDYISTDILKKIIIGAKKVGVKCVVLSGGEPTLHPDFLQILDIIHDFNLKICLSTNGTFFNKKMIEKFNDYKISLQLSLDTLDPVSYKNIRNSNTYNKVFNNLNLLLEQKINFNVGIVLFDESVRTLEFTIEKLCEMGIKTIHVDDVKSVGLAKNSKLLKLSNYYDTLVLLYQLQKKFYPKISIDFIENILLRTCSKTCPLSFCNCMGGNMIQADVKGNVCQCKNIPSTFIDNFFETDFFNLINNACKNIVTYKNINDCKNCKYGYICLGGCRSKPKQVYLKSDRCKDIYKFIDLVFKEKNAGKIDDLLFEIQLSNEYNKMNGYFKYI
jgi:radical SAM protein with 4Fe4S-binding SPASM domain